MRLDLKKWGNSLGLRIPKHIVEELSMQPNTQVECSVKEGKLVVEVVHQGFVVNIFGFRLVNGLFKLSSTHLFTNTFD